MPLLVLPFPFVQKVGAPNLLFSKLNTQPADASVYASTDASRRPPQNSRSGWIATPFLWDSFIPDYTPICSGARTNGVQIWEPFLSH